MMKNVIMVGGLLFLGACSHLDLNKPNCYESVAIAKISLDQAYSTAANLSVAEKISIDSAEKALSTLDMADSMVNSASALCPVDTKAANRLLDDADDLLDEATITLGENNNG